MHRYLAGVSFGKPTTNKLCESCLLNESLDTSPPSQTQVLTTTRHLLLQRRRKTIKNESCSSLNNTHDRNVINMSLQRQKLSTALASTRPARTHLDLVFHELGKVEQRLQDVWGYCMVCEGDLERLYYMFLRTTPDIPEEATPSNN